MKNTMIGQENAIQFCMHVAEYSDWDVPFMCYYMTFATCGDLLDVGMSDHAG